MDIQFDVKKFVDKIISDGNITHEEHENLLTLIKSDGKVDASELEQIGRLMELIEKGKVTVE